MSNKKFFLDWILCNVIGWGVGWSLNFVFAQDLPRLLASGDSQTYQVRFIVGAALLGISTGLVIGIAQWRVLKRWHSFSWVWIPANGIGASVGMILVYLWVGTPYSSLYLPTNSGKPEDWFLSFSVFSLCLAVAQMVVLAMKRIVLALAWLPVSFLMGCLGLLFGYIFCFPLLMPFFGTVMTYASLGWIGRLLLGLAAGGIAGIILGIPTGGVLLALKPKRVLNESVG